MVIISNGILIVLKWQNVYIISNIKDTAIFSKIWPSSLLYIQQRRVRNSIKRLSKEAGKQAGKKHFHKKLHLRFLIWFWIHDCPISHKDNQTIYSKGKQHDNHKASYINVLNHWKTLETTLTMESNNRNKMAYLQYQLFHIIQHFLWLTISLFLPWVVSDARICKPHEILPYFLL